MHAEEKLANYLHYYAKLYDDIFFIPTPLFPNPFAKRTNIPFFSIENAFNQQDRQTYLKKWEVIKPHYIVIDTRKNWLRNSADYLVQEFEQFVERNYRIAKQLDYFTILSLDTSKTVSPAYQKISVKHSEPQKPYPHSLSEDARSVFEQEEKLAAVDMSYTFIKPSSFPAAFMRPLLRICPLRNGKELFCKEISLPYTNEEPIPLRVKFRKNTPSADALSISFAPFLHTLFRPIKAELFFVTPLKLSEEHFNINGLSLQKERKLRK